MSSLVLNFDEQDQYVFRANAGLRKEVVLAEEEFGRIIHDVEAHVSFQMWLN